MLTDMPRFSLAFGLSGTMHAVFLYALPIDFAPLPPSQPVAGLQVRIAETPARPGIRPTVPSMQAGVASALPSEPRVRTPVQPLVAWPVAIRSAAQPDRPQPAPAANNTPGLETAVAETASIHSESASAPLAPSNSPARTVETLADEPQPLAGTQSLEGTPAAPLDAPVPSFAPAPDYPEEARWERRVGRALLAFQLRPDGSAMQIQLLASSGHADLDSAALESLKQWRFNQPSGARAAVWYKYAFRFELM